MAKLIAGASIASTAGDTPPNGSNLPTDPMNKVQGIPSGIRNMPESGSRSAPSHPRCPQQVGKDSAFRLDVCFGSEADIRSISFDVRLVHQQTCSGRWG